MAETLGSLCDKLTIVKLKQYHSNDPEQLASLSLQERQLQDEIDDYIKAALSGQIAIEKLVFAPNKVYKKEGNNVPEVRGSIGEVDELGINFQEYIDFVLSIGYRFERVIDGQNYLIIPKKS
jgi:hypothetical protein